MKRTKQQPRASAILTGDWHLREDQPTCRTDDYWETQWKKVEFIAKLQQLHGCPVFHSGDLFDHWKPSPRLLAKTFLTIPDDMWCVYGNHDLPQHSMELKEKCGLYALASGAPDRVHIMQGGHWGEGTSIGIGIGQRQIFVMHMPVYERHVPPWHQNALTAKELLKMSPQYDLILTGDNHDQFVVRSPKGRMLVNAGSLTRMTADQINFEPAVFLWYAEDNSVQRVPIPIEEGVVSREHLEEQEKREARYEAFIQRLRQEGEPELSFRGNLERYFQSNKTLPGVRRLILYVLEDPNG